MCSSWTCRLSIGSHSSSLHSSTVPNTHQLDSFRLSYEQVTGNAGYSYSTAPLILRVDYTSEIGQYLLRGFCSIGRSGTSVLDASKYALAQTAVSLMQRDLLRGTEHGDILNQNLPSQLSQLSKGVVLSEAQAKQVSSQQAMERGASTAWLA